MRPESHPLLESSGAVRKEPGHWVAEVPRSWWSWSGPLGGLMNAHAIQAAADLVDANLVPLASHMRFLHAPSGDALSMAATVERAGKSVQFVSVRGEQNDEAVVTATIVCGQQGDEPAVQRVSAPEVPTPEECPEVQFPPDLVPFGLQFEFRQACGSYPMSQAERAEMGAWVRLRPGVPVDPLVAIVMMDAMPPGLYAAMSTPAAIVSAELSIHLNADLAKEPVDDYVLAVQRNITSAGGWCIDEADLWTRDGVLLAQSRQARRILPLGGK